MSSESSASPVMFEASGEVTASPPGKRTRTVAMIKFHALDHRFEIERRILEAGFEIVKERQMEFDIETDPETMFELFGAEYESFGEGPVWVYVLERRRAVETWRSLMGDPDPEVAKEESPNSLRALYGLSKAQNAVMGCPDVQVAEIQIQTIFASSPPFRTTELPDTSDSAPSDSTLSLNCEFQGTTSPTSPTASMRRTVSQQSSETRASTVNGNTTGSGGKPTFHARPIPATNAKPDIVPRMSRAAALRIGADVEKPVHYPATPESLAKTFEGVPGHKRSETIHVASTEPPAIAPRMTRAASLRLGLEVPVKNKPRQSTASATPSDPFEGVPGHKRRETISVASTRPPVMPPRTNRSATLRVHKEAAPPSSFNIRNGAMFSRSSSRSSDHPQATRPASATSVSRPPVSRAATGASTSTTSASSPPPRSALALKPANGSNVNGGTAKPTSPPAASAAKPKPRPSVVQAPPSIAPRTNKSAMLRAAKMANTAANGSTNGNGVKRGSVPAKTPVKKVLVPRVVKAAA